MTTSRVLFAVGSVCLVVAGGFLVIGSADTKPWLILGAGAVGAGILVIALVLRRGRPTQVRTPDPELGERLIRWITRGLLGLGAVAVVVAVVVAVGEARGHAIFHLLTGLVCLGQFTALGYRWHPQPGGGAATLRGLTLILLAGAACGAFLESIGGAGYDAANGGHRIEALTTLHNAVMPFGALVMVAVPLAVVTGIVVLVARLTHRDPIRPTP